MQKKSASATNELIVHFRAGRYSEKLKQVATKNNVSVGKWAKNKIFKILDGEEKNTDPDFSLSRRCLEDKKRISISLTTSELEAIHILMNTTKTPTVSQMLVKIIRAFLLKKPIFSNDELIALRRATIELQALGRNINQIAIHYHIGKISEADKFTQKQLTDLSQQFIDFSDSVSRVLVSTYKRYGIDYE